ncbi:MAG TPA: hypothetical protein VM802_03195 [Chitinophaga sp.]|uniref:hypothetical protein n=1 Tax=Chitinophaga sp. TaxID=1869181 RepID=UPI002C4E8567|nr:hypothetical protein [Chitinophaga sp.]HVI43841.1 hypothetical protein [Chitinophaga sp.]
MYNSFTYLQLQKMFCSGFSFMPIDALELYDRFIYKSYAANANIQTVLDRYARENDLAGVHASVLLLKMRQKDIPVAAALLGHLKYAVEQFRNRAGLLLRCPEEYRRLLVAMEEYREMLDVYQEDVQLYITARLSAAESREGEIFEEPTAGNIHQLQVVAREFLLRTEEFLDIVQRSTSEVLPSRKPMLMPEERNTILEIIKSVVIFKGLQGSSIYILEQWREQAIYINKLQKLN